MSEALKKILTAAVRAIHTDSCECGMQTVHLTKVAQFGDEDRGAGVYRDSDWNEYRVLTVGDGVHLKGADYHTGDKQDALDTAELITKPNQREEPVAAETEEARPLPTRPRGFYAQPSSLLDKLLGRLDPPKRETYADVLLRGAD
jgi:hypothetical protein